VIDAGEIDGGAALVTDFYRRNLQAVIQGKVAVDGRNLYHVVRSIVQGSGSCTLHAGARTGCSAPARS
jgi:hypothetical protein